MLFFKFDGDAAALARSPTSELSWAAASEMALQLGEVGPALLSTRPALTTNSSNEMVQASARETGDGTVIVLVANTANDLADVTLTVEVAADSLEPEAVQLFTYAERCNASTQIECPSGYRTLPVERRGALVRPLWPLPAALGARGAPVRCGVT